MSVLIPLSSGDFAVVDDADAALVLSRNWHVKRRGMGVKYAKANVCSAGKVSCVYMHRLILGAAPGQFVDHIDGDGLNNTRANLRLCTNKENSRNRTHGGRGKSGYIGVYHIPYTGSKVKKGLRAKPWAACITVNGKEIKGGYFATAEEAARKRDELSVLYHGEFASLNFPAERGLA